MDMVQSNGRTLRFSVETGKVVSTISAQGVETTAEQYAEKLQVTRQPGTNAIESIWSASQGLLKAVPQGNKLVLEWYAPAQVKRTSNAILTSGTPYKTASYEKSEDGNTMYISHQRAGMPAFHTERRTEGNNVTIITGEGDERIIRKIERNLLPGSLWEMIESYRRITDKTPSSCVRTVKQFTAGGWLTLSKTKAYGSPEAQTTIYTYNNDFRLALEVKPNGGYTRYEYDTHGRPTLIASPWAGGGEKGTRINYADLRFNDFRISKEAEILIASDGTETVLSTKSYTYDDSPQVNRTTITETALGSANTHTSIQETYGPSAPYPYARGRERFHQEINGVQTLTEYAPATTHGAIHTVTKTSMVNGSIVPGQSSRDVKYSADNGTVTRNERYVHTGKDWSLISAEDYEYDAELKLRRTTRANGRTSTTEWMCCGPLRKTDEAGITVSYAYNTAKQLVESIRSATETTPETIVSYVRDAQDRTLEIRRDIGPMTTRELTSYDPVGRVVSTTDVLGRTTHKSYSKNLLVDTTTLPSGATLITKRYYDGSVILQSGTGQREIETRMELTPQGILTTRLTGNVILARQLSNGFGETVREDIPNTQGGWISTRITWNARGQQIRRQTEQMAPTLTAYDELGQVARQTMVLDPHNPGDPAANRITSQSTSFIARAEGIYQIQTTTTYNHLGQPLVQIVEQLVSVFDPTLESKTVTTDIYGKQRMDWAEYTAPARRTTRTLLPTSDIVAEQLVIDGYTVSQKDTAGVITTQSRTYTATGLTLQQTDARGNTTTTQTDLAGRPVSVADAAGNTSITAYDPRFDQPSCITNALGNTACYAYDLRGRKTAEYGTAIQPVCFAYDDAGNLIRLITFRADTGDITTDPRDRTDGDVTAWTYDQVTGLELQKTYADGSHILKTYDAMNRLHTFAKARGIVTTYAYAQLTGELLSTNHSDGTTPWSFSYNYLGQIISVSDASGTHNLSYNTYGRALEDSWNSVVPVSVLEHYDAWGRPSGYQLSLEEQIVQSSILEYDSCGRISALSLDGVNMPFTWVYDPLTGWVETLSYPGGLFRSDSYDTHRKLLSDIAYTHQEQPAPNVRHSYEYDSLSRPTQRLDTHVMSTVQTSSRLFTYNNRSELIGDQQDTLREFTYTYDNIGNRIESQEFGIMADYRCNVLNQYAGIVRDEQSFLPEFDADGNQTKLQTATGGWTVIYDANDRPVQFTSEDGTVVVTCGYDYRGRRFEKKVTANGHVTSHARYHYRGYLQIAEINLLATPTTLVRSYLWDPTQSTSTCPLQTTIWQQDGTQGESCYYALDSMKNVTALFNVQGECIARYVYSPFGQFVSQEGNLAVANKFRFSSEYMDDELGLIYYNYRHLNPLDGRWISRDMIDEMDSNNLYGFVKNRTTFNLDYLGNSEYRGYGCNGTMLPPSAYRSADPCSYCPQGSRTRSISEKKSRCCEYRTKKQKSGYVPPTNGCGSDGGSVQPPDDFNMFNTTINFLPACNAHDTCYGTCGSKKSDCDSAFLRDMKQACLNAMTGKGIDLGMLPVCESLALIYYNAVSFFGYCAYEEAQDKACEWKNCS